ncbi:hypothetical protein ACFFMN_23405 [Planobispora siamensis]|uniref:Uncharacterized protein n=1 Tax=Planobispora siamensis TaxID=936338 RepID=A0A8J3WPY3_9ACTN|nr:hypothetical protein [Planobispora siamensis]GIH95311.1 hypothetical protein Psi01_59410 [Planobispora siamensis]
MLGFRRFAITVIIVVLLWDLVRGNMVGVGMCIVGLVVTAAVLR